MHCTRIVLHILAPGPIANMMHHRRLVHCICVVLQATFPPFPPLSAKLSVIGSLPMYSCTHHGLEASSRGKPDMRNANTSQALRRLCLTMSSVLRRAWHLVAKLHAHISWQ